MEFPEGMHHYFEEKLCTFHHWSVHIRPRKTWEEYHRFAELEAAGIGYHLTFPPEDVMRSTAPQSASGQPSSIAEKKPSEGAQGASPTAATPS